MPTTAGFINNLCGSLRLEEAPKHLRSDGWRHTISGEDHLGRRYNLGTLSTERHKAGSDDWIDPGFYAVLDEWPRWASHEQYLAVDAKATNIVRAMVEEIV